MLSKTLALAIAIVLFVELLRDKRPRYLVSLCAGCWMLVLLLLTHPPAVLEALSLHSFLTPRFWFAHGGVTELNVGINWSTMFFLTGMMVLVEGMGEAGFFDWVSLRLARALGFRPMAILLSFMILAALLAMFVDSVTVILFLVAATVRLAQYLRFDPVPLIIGEIFAANLGGAATMTGDPPNIILGTSLGLSFWDFLQNNGIICLAGLGLALVYFYVCFHNKLKRREKGQTTYTATLEAVAKSLPGLWRAEKLQSKAEKAGFEWPNAQAALDKLAEELGELQSAVADDTNIKEELGDLLFAAVKVARFFHIDPEEALEGTCEKFIRRFSAVEAAVTAQGQDMKDVDVSQLMVYWNRAKHPAKDEIEETEEEKGQST